MDNAGMMNRVDSQFVAWFGAVYPENEGLLAKHKQGGGIRPWLLAHLPGHRPEVANQAGCR